MSTPDIKIPVGVKATRFHGLLRPWQKSSPNCLNGPKTQYFYWPQTKKNRELGNSKHNMTTSPHQDWLVEDWKRQGWLSLTGREGGFGGGIIRGVPRSLWRKRVMTDIPAWPLSETQVRELLLRVFPRMKSNPTHRKRAIRWWEAIRIYYRAARPVTEVAHALNITVKQAQNMMRRIEKAAKGLRTTGHVRTNGKRGRRKIIKHTYGEPETPSQINMRG